MTFISNGFWLIDVVHTLNSWCLKKCHQYKHKDSVLTPEFKDDYVFDLGYHQSYSLVIFLNCLIFSCLVPIISVFAALFFYLKYLIDKYNLIFVYFKVFESGGKIRKVVNDHMHFNVVVYLFITTSFFSIKFQSEIYFWSGIAIMIFWLLLYFILKKKLVVEYKLDKNLTHN